MSNPAHHQRASRSKEQLADLEQRVLRLFKRPNISPLDAAGIRSALSMSKQDMPLLDQALTRLESTGRLARVRKEHYTLPLEADLVPGRILVSRNGNAILQPEDPKLPRVTIPATNTSTALHHDRVLVRQEISRIAPQETEGKVIRILERARTRISGTLARTSQFLYVVPDDPRIPHDIYVPSDLVHGQQAAVGEKVVVELVEWQSRHTNPEGRLVERIGSPRSPGVDILSIIRQYNLPEDFPDAVVREAEDFGRTVTTQDLKGRKDLRKHNVITIDPDDAKDFDDAIYLEPLPNQRWRLWIHIADVSHYVKNGSALDQEAESRGNSTYLVDRVIPMLPEVLSNNLCSLVPNADRLTKSAEFILSNRGDVQEVRFHSSVIHSKRRFTYQEAFQIIQTNVPSNPIEKMLLDAHRLAQRLRQKRFRAGSLNLDFPEHKIRLDPQGNLLRVDRSENDASHQLIEEFMLLANEGVARALRQRRQPTLYRIHEQPDAARLDELRQEMASQGIRTANLSKKGELPRLIDKLKEHPAGEALQIAVLRSMKRARYAVSPLGHFGLAKLDYTHFTSPIRRYADLIVHRTLFERPKIKQEQLIDAADHISFTERNSGDAEQDSKTIKLLRHLEHQLQSNQFESYEAVVNDVRNFGFFVDLPALGMSGLVRVSSLENDFYHFDQRRHELLGRRTKRKIAVGQRVTVRVHSIDDFKRQANFTLVSEPRQPRKDRPSGKRRPQQPNRAERPQRPERQQQPSRGPRSRRRRR